MDAIFDAWYDKIIAGVKGVARSVFKEEIGPLDTRLGNLDTQLQKAEEAQKEAGLKYQQLLDDLKPLLQKTEVADKDGKPVMASTLLVDLRSLILTANGIFEAATVQVKDEAGNTVEAPLGPNLKNLFKQALVEYAASEKGREMAILRMDAQDRVDAGNAQTIMAATQKLQDPAARAALEQGAAIQEESDLVKEIVVGKDGKGGLGLMTENQFDRAVAFARRRGIGQNMGGGSSGGGGGGGGQGATF